MQCVRTHNNIGQITELHNAGEGFVEKPSRLSVGNKDGYSYSQRSIRGHFMIDHPTLLRSCFVVWKSNLVSGNFTQHKCSTILFAYLVILVTNSLSLSLSRDHAGRLHAPQTSHRTICAIE